MFRVIVQMCTYIADTDTETRTHLHENSDKPRQKINQLYFTTTTHYKQLHGMAEFNLKTPTFSTLLNAIYAYSSTTIV